MENSLIDAGPLIALFNKRDRYHLPILHFLKGYNAIFWTTWPVLTEASHMLDFSLKAQLNLLEWVKELLNLNKQKLSIHLFACK